MLEAAGRRLGAVAAIAGQSRLLAEIQGEQVGLAVAAAGSLDRQLLVAGCTQYFLIHSSHHPMATAIACCAVSVLPNATCHAPNRRATPARFQCGRGGIH